MRPSWNASPSPLTSSSADDITSSARPRYAEPADLGACPDPRIADYLARRFGVLGLSMRSRRLRRSTSVHRIAAWSLCSVLRSSHWPRRCKFCAQTCRKSFRCTPVPPLFPAVHRYRPVVHRHPANGGIMGCHEIRKPQLMRPQCAHCPWVPVRATAIKCSAPGCRGCRGCGLGLERRGR